MGEHMKGSVRLRAAGVVAALAVVLGVAVSGTGVSAAQPAPPPTPAPGAAVLEEGLSGPEVLAQRADAIPQIAATTRMSAERVQQILQDQTSHVSADGGIFYAEPPPATAPATSQVAPGPYPYGDT